MVRLTGYERRQAVAALGRAAAARRARAGAREPAPRAAARRAARRPRPEAPRGDAARAEGDPAGGRDHVHLRDPRPGGGAHDERPPGRLQPAAGSSSSARRPTSTSARRRAFVAGLRRHVEPAPRRAAAQALVGSDGLFTVRPEKIRLAEPGAPVADDEVGADGTIRNVVYLGPDTRYIVALDAGSDLVVTQQNLNTSSMEALAAQGQPVRLVWKRQHVLRVQE